MKKILVIVIPIVTILCVAAGLLVWYFRPINRINRAFDEDNYEQVVNLYSSLRNESDIDTVEERLKDIAEEYYSDYLKEKMSYKDAASYFDLIQEEIFRKDKKIRKLREELEEICESRRDYAHACDCMEKGEYLEALEYYRKVSELDKAYIKLADDKISECSVLIVDGYISKADELIGQEKYDEAEAEVLAGLDIFPEDEQLSTKLEEILNLKYSDIEGKWSCTYDFGDLIAEELGLSGYKLYFPAELVYEFIDGNFSMYVDEDSIKPALEAMTADEDSMKALYVVAEQYGVSKLEADMLVAIMYGGSYADFLMDQYGTEISNALDAFNYKSSYAADSKKVYIGTTDRNNDNYYLYEQVNSILSLEEYVGSINPLNVLEYPLRLKRKVR